MATTESSSNKRRRRFSSFRLKIYDLPIEPLTHVADFLSLPSRAMFAAALAAADAPFSGEGGLSSTENSQKIAGDACEILDFGDIEKDLAIKLRDDDIDVMRTSSGSSAINCPSN